MLDSARCLESRDYYRRFIDFSAERGVNTLLWHFTDDQGCALRFDALPEAASTNAYSKPEMRGLIDYARLRGINIIPELASLGHTRFITALPAYADLAESEAFFSSICPTAPRTQELIGQLLEETVALFDSPLIHIGLDETNIGHHPLTRKALRDRDAGQIFAEHVNRLHRQLARHNRRTMMWADQLLADPSIVPDIPRDILLCNWQYDPQVCQKSTRQLLEWGFEVVVCPALISHNQPVYPGESFALPNIRAIARHLDLSRRVIGTITTVWTPTRFLPDSLWPAMHYAAAVMNRGPEVDPRHSLVEFARTFYALPPTASWLEAMLALHRHAPHRTQWAAVARLISTDALDRIDLSGGVERFNAIRDALRSAYPAVERNIDSYESLLLLLDVLSHAWRRALEWRTDRLTFETLRRSQRLSNRLAQAWDAHRASDDPRKTDTHLLFDSADHMLAAFDEGTQIIRDALEPAAAEALPEMAGTPLGGR